MKKLLLILLALVLLLLPLVSAAAVLEQSFTSYIDGNVPLRHSAPYTYINYNTVTGNHSYSIDVASYALKRFNTPVGYVYVELYNGTDPNVITRANMIGMSNLVDATTFSTDVGGSWANFTFNSSIPVANGQVITTVFKATYAFNSGTNLRVVDYAPGANPARISGDGSSWSTDAASRTLSFMFWSNSTAVANNFSVTAYDVFTNMSLTNFTVNISGTYYPTTNGTVNTALLTNSTQLWTIQVLSNESGGYFSRTETGVNVSSNKQYSLSQSVITFAATQKISNATIASTTFTSVNGSKTYAINGTQYMKASVYNVTASKSGYFSKTQQFTITPLEVSTKTIENMSDVRLNLTVRDAVTNALVTTYTATLNLSTYSYSEGQSTTNGSIYSDLISGNWSIDVDATNYALTTSNVTLTSGLNNVTLYVQTTNSYNIRFVDEITNQLITTANITIGFIGSVASYNRTTSNGTLYIDLLMPDDYVIRYNASNSYSPGFYFVTLTNRTTTNLTLYMLSSAVATNVTASVIDLAYAGRAVENAFVYVQKYDINSNTYITRSIIRTGISGTGVFPAALSSEFYKFIVQYPLGTVMLETSPEYLRTSTITLPISTLSAGPDEFFTIYGISGDVSFNPSTNNFRFTYVDPSSSIEQSCLDVYIQENNFTKTLYNSSCTTSASGTILVGVSNASAVTYVGEGYVIVDNVRYDINSDAYSFTSAAIWGRVGIFLTGLMVLLFVFMFKNLFAALIAAPIPILALSVIGLISWPFWIPTTFLMMSWLGAYLVRKEA